MGENGYMYLYGWVTLLSTGDYHDIVNQLYSDINEKFFSLKYGKWDCLVRFFYADISTSSWPLAQNKPYAKEAYFRVVYSGTLNYLPLIENVYYIFKIYYKFPEDLPLPTLFIYFFVALDKRRQFLKPENKLQQN